MSRYEFREVRGVAAQLDDEMKEELNSGAEKPAVRLSLFTLTTVCLPDLCCETELFVCLFVSHTVREETVCF